MGFLQPDMPQGFGAQVERFPRVFGVSLLYLYPPPHPQTTKEDAPPPTLEPHVSPITPPPPTPEKPLGEFKPHPTTTEGPLTARPATLYPEAR